MDIQTERQRYEDVFAGMDAEFADVEFTVNDLVTTQEQAEGSKENWTVWMECWRSSLHGCPRNASDNPHCG